MAVSTWSAATAASWRDTDGWRSENYAYQGDWGWGKHRGYWYFNDASIRATLADQDILRVRFRMTRLNTSHGASAAGVPTIRLHNYSSQPSGTPNVGIGGTSSHGASFTRGETDWAELPVSWGRHLRDGTAKGLGVYTTSNLPYLIFSKTVVLEITYEPSISAPPTPTGFSLNGANTSAVWMGCNVAGSTAANNLASHYRFDREGGGSVLKSNPGFTNTGLPSGHTDRWRVRAENPGGVSSYTGWLTGKTVPLPPNNLRHTSATTSSITMAFSGSNGADIGYRVDHDGGTTYFTTSGSVTVPGLSPGTSYQFRVRAESSTPNNTGGNSDYSDWVTMWTAPVAVNQPVISGETHDALTIDWNSVASADSYRVERRPQGGTFALVVNTPNTTFEDVSLTPGETYEYRVRAEGPGGEAAWSPTATTTTVPLPDVPTGLAATVVNTHDITLQWNASTGAVSYRVQRLSMSSVVQNTWTTSDLTLIDYTVSPGVSYYYRVRAESNLGGTSDYSPSLQVDSEPMPQSAPELDDLGNIDAAESKTFSWVFNSGNLEDVQTQRQIQIRRVSDSVLIVDSASITDSESFILAASTLTNDEDYEWRVRTRDSFAALFGPWSGYQQFETITPPTAVITLPVDGGSYAVQELPVTWTYSQAALRPQTEFRVVVNVQGGAQVFDSGWVQSSSDTINVPGLETDTYEIFVMVGSGGVRSTTQDVVSNVAVATNTLVFTGDTADVVWLNNDDGKTAGDGVFRFNVLSPTNSGADTYYMFPKGDGWQKVPAPSHPNAPASEGWKSVRDIECKLGSNVVLSFEAKVEDALGNAWPTIDFPTFFQIRAFCDQGMTFDSPPVFLNGESYDVLDADGNPYPDMTPKYVEIENGYRRYTTSISTRHKVQSVEVFATILTGTTAKYLYITNLDVHRSGRIYSEEYVDSGMEGGLMLSGDGYILGSRIELMGRRDHEQLTLKGTGLYLPKSLVEGSPADRSFMQIGSDDDGTTPSRIVLYSGDDTSSEAGNIVMKPDNRVVVNGGLTVKGEVMNDFGPPSLSTGYAFGGTITVGAANVDYSNYELLVAADRAWGKLHIWSYDSGNHQHAVVDCSMSYMNQSNPRGKLYLESYTAYANTFGRIRRASTDSTDIYATHSITFVPSREGTYHWAYEPHAGGALGGFADWQKGSGFTGGTMLEEIDLRHSVSTGIWVPLPFASGWTDYSSQYSAGGYMFGPGATVHLRGLVKRVSGTSDTIASFPQGLRPKFRRIFPSWSNGAAGRVDIQDSGSLTLSTGNGTYVSLENMTWDTTYTLV